MLTLPADCGVTAQRILDAVATRRSQVRPDRPAPRPPCPRSESPLGVAPGQQAPGAPCCAPGAGSLCPGNRRPGSLFLMGVGFDVIATAV